MLDDNTNKIMWVGVAVGIVAMLGISALVLYPDTISNGKVVIVDKIHQFTGSKDVEENTKFTWSYSGDNATVTGFASGKSSSSVEIPDYRVYKGKTYKVTSIASGAFAYYGSGTSSVITSVTLGNYVAKIESGAFAYNNISSLFIPGNVKSVGADAFLYSPLTSLTISDGVESIEESAFSGNKLTNLTIPKSVQTVELGSFTQGTGASGEWQTINWLSSAELHAGIFTGQSIDTLNLSSNPGAMSGMTINHLNLKNGVTKIPSFAFAGDNVQTVSFPDSLKSIGAYAFVQSKLESVTIPSSVLTIGDSAFLNDSLTNVTMSKSTKLETDTVFTSSPKITYN